MSRVQYSRMAHLIPPRHHQELRVNLTLLFQALWKFTPWSDVVWMYGTNAFLNLAGLATVWLSFTFTLSLWPLTSRLS